MSIVERSWTKEMCDNDQHSKMSKMRGASPKRNNV